jgi:hypothetical protein
MKRRMKGMKGMKGMKEHEKENETPALRMQQKAKNGLRNVLSRRRQGLQTNIRC